jgi:ABC-2 type transport system permease protein
MTQVKGFCLYSKFIFRRERITSLIWIAGMVLMNTVVALAFTRLFETDESIQQMVSTLSSPAMQAIVGPIYGPAPSVDNIMIVFAQEMLVFMMITSVIMNIFFINRHTRTDEELGRIEMIRSLPVGKLTVSVSALVFAFGLNAFISLLMAFGLLWANIAGTTVMGVFVYSFAIGIAGFLFACITLLTAQIFQDARSASTWAFMLLGVFYVVRAYADMSQNMIFNYISPLGLGLHVHAFHADRIWPLVILLIQSAIIAAAALLICSKRDLGEGIVPAKKGRKNASVFLQSPLGLAWRLTKNSIIVWIISMFCMGATYGAVLGDISGFVENNDMFSQLITGGETGLTEKMMVDSFVGFMYIIMALLATVPVISIAGKIHSEEKRGRLEGIFARSVSRGSMYGSYILISVVGSGVFMICGSLGIYAAAGDLTKMSDLIWAAAAYVPSLLVIMGIIVLLAGLLPKLTALVWGVFAYSFIAVYFGRILNLPELMVKITPYGIVPQYTDIVNQEFDFMPFVILTAIAIVLTVSGIFAFSRRDIKQ